MRTHARQSLPHPFPRVLLDAHTSAITFSRHPHPYPRRCSRLASALTPHPQPPHSLINLALNPLTHTVQASSAITRLYRPGVLAGEFSCCRMQHKVTNRDGSTSVIPCDKPFLQSIMRAAFDGRTGQLLARLVADGNFPAHSVLEAMEMYPQFCELTLFKLTEPHIFATGTSEIQTPTLILSDHIYSRYPH